MSLFGPIKKVKIVNNHNSIVTGESFDKLYSKLDNLNKNEKRRLKDSSFEIIKNCVNPNFAVNNKENNTGLVIGKIQSGKTLSFTSVAALARDNGYRLIIIISGRTNLLLKQTVDRLKTDLVTGDKYISLITNAETKEKKGDTLRQIKRVLNKRDDQPTKTIIIPVLKHQVRLGGLRRLFAVHEIQNLLKKKAVLIIDDEADQASLNTKARTNERFGFDDESAIFSSIKNLRYSLPNHTYIQYTATPQAPLLIDTATLLSPDWHVLLTPGDSYTGGNVFFDDNREIVDIIPQEGDYPPAVNHLTSAPDSLENALIEFLILSAIMGGDIDGTKLYNDRSTMLVHPTWRVVGDEENVAIETFFDWIQNIIEMLERDLESGDFQSFAKEFDKIKTRLIETGWSKKLPNFEDIMSAILNWVLDDLKVHQVTGGKIEKGEEFPWDNHRYHILVGGQLLDRGFTVENLIMTYMPRDTVGNNQADTIEQRCRFYGYRKKYIDFCRVYITKGLMEDYINYNLHETELHKYLFNHSLAEFMKEGSKMMMNRNLIPTNMSRLSKSIISNHLKGLQHFNPQPPYIKENNNIFTDFIRQINNYTNKILEPKIENHQKENVKHKVTKVPISSIIELLLNLELNNKHEIMKRASILRYIDHLKNEFDFCWVIEIAHCRKEPRERTVHFINKPKAAKNQFDIPSGGFAAGDTDFKDGYTYFGDRNLLIETDPKKQSTEYFGYNGELIMQIHKIAAKRNTPLDSIIRDKEFYSVAFNFSDKLETRYISTQN